MSIPPHDHNVTPKNSYCAFASCQKQAGQPFPAAIGRIVLQHGSKDSPTSVPTTNDEQFSTQPDGSRAINCYGHVRDGYPSPLYYQMLLDRCCLFPGSIEESTNDE